MSIKDEGDTYPLNERLLDEDPDLTLSFLPLLPPGPERSSSHAYNESKHVREGMHLPIA